MPEKKPNISIRWDKSGTAGTMKTTSYTLEIIVKKKKTQWTFCWRPDVTKYYWGKKYNKTID